MRSPATAQPIDPARPARRDRRDELRDAAIRVFCEKGYAAATIADIAAEIGVLKGSVYHYISTKDVLLEWIFDAARGASQERLNRIAALDVPPVERLFAFVEDQVSWYLENRECAVVLFREYRYLTGTRRRVVAEHRGEYEAFVRALIEDCQRSGALTPGVDAVNASRFVFGGLESTPTWYLPDGEHTPAQIAAQYAQLTLRALGAHHPDTV